MSITLKTDHETIHVEDGKGQFLTDIAEGVGLQLNTRCGGAGVCGSCACKLSKGDFLIRNESVSVRNGGYEVALSCQTRVVSKDAEVHFPHTSLVEQSAQIVDDFDVTAGTGEPLSHKIRLTIEEATLHCALSDQKRVQNAVKNALGLSAVAMPLDVLQALPGVLQEGQNDISATVSNKDGVWMVIDIEAGDTTRHHYGVAVDIGTTTVATLLVNLNDRSHVAQASMYNQQIVKADDVASRISCSNSREALAALQGLVVEDTLNALVTILCEQTGIDARHIVRMVVSGNTVMSHLFLGISPQSIGRLPFQPVTNEYPACLARTLSLAIHPNAIVNVVPSIAGYIGGDITSDIHVAGLCQSQAPTLLVDIGTNGEIVFSEAGRMQACATAAGPAFEGYGIQHGCRAAAGAIERIRFDRELIFDIGVIGGEKAVGLCGSAVIDFIAEGLRCGLISQMGRFDEAMLKAGGAYLKDAALCGNAMACIIVRAEDSGIQGPIFVTEQDIAQALKAKAAIYAGMKTLLETQGKRFSDLERFCLAGGFARYINLENAICMGMLPEIPLERYDVIGNGSLAGAYLALVDADTHASFAEVIQIPESVELNLEPAFESHFVDALALPNMDPDDFPGTLAAITRSATAFGS